MKKLHFFLWCVFCVFAFPIESFPWPVPDTGQTKCYDEVGNEISCAGTGQDGEYLINPPSYTKLDANGNDLPDSATSWMMVRDNVTGLIWEVKQNMDGVVDYSNPHDADNTYTWYDPNPETNGGDVGIPGDGTDTEDFIAALNAAAFGGYTDWRLPTREELRSIVDYSKPFTGPTIVTSYFPNTVSTGYWSSSTGTDYTGYAWIVNYGYGYDIRDINKSSSWHVRAVRGGETEAFGHLVINDDDTVTDADTGLMWRKATDGPLDWETGLTHYETLGVNGYSDWRLPTIKELASIVALDRYDPAIDTAFFPDTVSSDYWSSSTYVSNRGHAWFVHFYYGLDHHGSRSDNWYIRAVRGGQQHIPGNLLIHKPRRASFWNVNSTLPITWDTSNIPGNVNISISYEGGKTGTYKTIAANTPNDGSYNWVIGETASFNCMLKIEPLSDPSKGTVQGLFTIFDYIESDPSSLGLKEPANSGDTPESKTFVIALSKEPGGSIEFNLESTNPGEFIVSPTSVTLNQSNWNIGVQVTVTPQYDGVADGDQISAVLASTNDNYGAFQAKNLPLVQVIIQDSDTRTTIQSVSPTLGIAGQPLDVTLKGTNFDNNTKIYISPDGGVAIQIAPVTVVNGTTISFTIPAKAAGSYTLKADDFELRDAVEFANSVIVQGRKRAVIVAGGSPFRENSLWLATEKCAKKAYQTLALLGYEPESIQYLNRALWSDVTGNGENDIDADGTSATLQAAIASLNSGNTDELLLYMVGPGGNEKFQFGSNAAPEYLAASTLDSWLDGLQSRISGEVVVIYDAPQSGTFLSKLQPPGGRERIVITGASPGERSWFLDDGEISFSYRFFAHLFDNAELFQAFDSAKDDVELLQTPRIDANGDGTPDARGKSRNNDTYVVGRGRFVDIDPPTIGTLTANPPQLYSGNTTSTVAAGSVDADTGLSRVWARVIPPIESMKSPDEPVLTVPTFKMFDLNGNGVYEHEYGEFIHEGDYRVFAYAIDLMGFQSFPKLVQVRQNNGELPAKKGDVNLDQVVDLRDAILVVKFLSGFDSAYPAVIADANGDERIGLADAVYILQEVGKCQLEYSLPQSDPSIIQQ